MNDREVNILEFTQCSKISKVEMKGLLMIYLVSLADWFSVPVPPVKTEFCE